MATYDGLLPASGLNAVATAKRFGIYFGIAFGIWMPPFIKIKSVLLRRKTK